MYFQYLWNVTLSSSFYFPSLSLPYRAKVCQLKFSSGETIIRAKFSSLNEKFVTFAQRKVSPNKNKSVLKLSTSKPTSDLSHLDKF